MLFIVTYLMIGVLWALVKAYMHPLSVTFAEVEAELKKNRQKVPSYVSYCVVAILFCIILWPANLVAIILAGGNNK